MENGNIVSAEAPLNLDQRHGALPNRKSIRTASEENPRDSILNTLYSQY